MKKTFLKIATIFVTLLFTMPMAFADTQQKNTQQDLGQILFYPFVYKSQQQAGTKIGIVQSLPKGDQQELLTRIIQIILAITGTLALASFTYGGIMLLTAQGNEDSIGKAKKLIMWSVIALLIIATSYAITLGVSQLQFFGPQ